MTRWAARAAGDLTCIRNELNGLEAVKQGADGMPAADICRQAGILSRRLPSGMSERALVPDA